MIDDVVIVTDWNADAFHRRVLDLEAQGYAVRLDSYCITPEMNPETGEIIHLHRIELAKPDDKNDR
jgi:hypothetical protein